MATLDPSFVSSLYPGVLKSNLHKLEASSKQLTEIGNLAPYKNLQRIDLSNNALTSAKGLCGNSEITWLSVANNQLGSLQDVAKLSKLQILNAGGNALSGTVSLKNMSQLKAVILNNNSIERITGLNNMPHLNTVVVSHNRVKDLSKSLEGCSALTKLSLSHNKVKNLEALQSCTRLFELRLAHNRIKQLPESIRSLYRLRILDIAGNNILDTDAIKVLQDLKFLRHLVMKGNPICEKPDYWEAVVAMLPNLESLDGKKVSSRLRSKEEPGTGHRMQPHATPCNVGDGGEVAAPAQPGPTFYAATKGVENFAGESPGKSNALKREDAAGSKKTGVVAIVSGSKRKRNAKKDAKAEPWRKLVTEQVGMGGSSAWDNSSAP